MVRVFIPGRGNRIFLLFTISAEQPLNEYRALFPLGVKVAVA
jgi:hypothetical protein